MRWCHDRITVTREVSLLLSVTLVVEKATWHSVLHMLFSLKGPGTTWQPCHKLSRISCELLKLGWYYTHSSLYRTKCFTTQQWYCSCSLIRFRQTIWTRSILSSFSMLSCCQWNSPLPADVSQFIHPGSEFRSLNQQSAFNVKQSEETAAAW